MGKVYTNNGISFNLGGTTPLYNNNPTINRINFGSTGENGFIDFHQGTSTFGTLTIEALDQNLNINIDDGKLTIANGGTILITLGTTATSVLRFTTPAGTIAELRSNGDFRIAGTLATGYTF